MRINSKKTCKVSIICSAYNRERYLEKCVNSILSQTLADIELILIDNGSSDSTPKIVDRFAKKILVLLLYITNQEQHMVKH